MSKAKPEATAEIETLITRRLYKEARALIEKLRQAGKGNEQELNRLEGLVLARLGHRDEAQKVLSAVHDAGELDADSTGILARTWMDLYDRSGDKEHLRASRDLYIEGYEKSASPADLMYTGINVAAKSVLLGDVETARQYLPLVGTALAAIGKKGRDYWWFATQGELELLSGRYELAATWYGRAVGSSPNEIGSHTSTWLQAKRLLRALCATEEERNAVLAVFQHILDRPPGEWITRPPGRRLRVYAFDPSLARSMETAGMNEVTLLVPWESDLAEGPVGEYLEIVDYDPASGCFYEPVDLNSSDLRASNGVAPWEEDPKFHQQMVYGVATNVIDHFERALGRRALWASREIRDADGNLVEERFVRRLRVYPHAIRDANAYYSPAKKSLLFGYFPATTDDPKILPGGTVFSCLSHDVIAHETTHALLDGLHPHFIEATNADVLAFHEAFADIVALFQHFSHPEVLRYEIARSRGDLASGTVLGQLAQELGRAIGNYGALRDAIGGIDPQTKKWRPKKPSVTELQKEIEPHARGAILVSAIFEAFLRIYSSRIADLLRIATQGSGILPPGAIHPDLVDRLTAQASKTATHMLHICIRALDYCPPVDMTFGDYLRALITADAEVISIDTYNYRLAIIEAFQRRGIFPDDVRSLSVESLAWRPPRGDGIDLTPVFDSTWTGPTLSPEWRARADRELLWERMKSNAEAVAFWLNNHCSVDVAEELGLMLSSDAPGSLYRSNGVPLVNVSSVRETRRSTPLGDVVSYLVIEILQCRRGYLDPDKQNEVDTGLRERDAEEDGDFKFWGGCTLLVDPDDYQVRYAISKHIMSDRRLRLQRSFYSAETPTLRATYLGDPLRVEGAHEPFAVLHQTI